MAARLTQTYHYPPPPPFEELVNAFRADGRRASTTKRYGGEMVNGRQKDGTEVNLSLKGEVKLPQGATGRVILTACIVNHGTDITIDTAWLTEQATALGLVAVEPLETPHGVAVVGRIPEE